ncbi:MAG: shikimate kinase [Coriobacteriales bacterium]|nr:shikimate kinase [Coriobacteriales bacterium]
MAIDKRNIVLVGMPAAGKSTMGVLLAKKMRYNFIDTDITIQVNHDATLEELIAAQGNEALLKMEAEVLESIEPARTVIATGGSACYSAHAMEHLKTTGPIVYIYAAYEDVARRVGDVKKRGVIMPKGYTFKDLFLERSALYEQYADVTVDTTGISVARSVDLIADAVLEWLNS